MDASEHEHQAGDAAKPAAGRHRHGPFDEPHDHPPVSDTPAERVIHPKPHPAPTDQERTP